MLKKLYLFIIISTSINIAAQTNIDSLFSVAIKNSQEKNYELAIEKAKLVIDLDSSRNDVRLFIANAYAWNNDYASSKQYISKVYADNPLNNELYDTWLNVLLWNKEYSALLKTIDTAQTNGYNNQYNITLKKALAYQGLKQYNAGINYLNQNSSLLDSSAINYIYLELKKSSSKNTITGYYALDFFDKNSPTPQHLAYIDYGIAKSRNIFIFRLNYANRFNLEDFQPEADLYHIFKNNHYLYANYGFGIKNDLFPQHRFGIEYFFPFGDAYETSLGAKYFIYQNSKATVLTGHIGKYLSNTWLSLRPYYTLQEGSNAFAALFNARMYANNQISYTGIELGYGNSPDDRFVYSQPGETIWLSAYKIKLERNIAIKQSNELRLGVGYVYEEISKDSFRNRYLFEIIFKHRF